MTDPSWQDEKPWSAVDAELDRQRNEREKAEKGQKSANISLDKIIKWFKNLFQ